MQTTLADFIRDTPQGRVAETILRKCVHCGFCTATCPTYQLTGDELDGPRGRIYQIKQVLEGAPATTSIQKHLDRCLTCRSCETTCPSGVEYGKLVTIGREVVESQLTRPPQQRLGRWLLRRLVLNRPLFHFTYRSGQMLRAWLPAKLRSKVLPRQAAGSLPHVPHTRRMLLLAGCVQPSMAPNIHAATVRVLDKLAISAISPAQAGCCGAINLHMEHADDGLADMRRNIDAWWPLIEQGAEAVVIDASGCGSMVKEYGYHLRHDAAYADKAARISALAKDIVEVVVAEAASLAHRLPERSAPGPVIAYHPPCSLQHGQKLGGQVERLLAAWGYPVLLPQNSHLCCGSAGTYAFLQPQWSERLRDDKLQHLQRLQPQLILSANIGCIAQLASGTDVPVRHWIEFLDELLTQAESVSGSLPQAGAQT